MRRRVACGLWLAGSLVLGVRAAAAQSRDRLAEGIRAYQNVDFDLAARLLRQEVAQPGSGAAAPADRARALMYLGAAELFREQRDSAAAVFRRLVALDPRYRPDRLTFPPEVTTAFERVRDATKMVTIVPPADAEIAPGTETMGIWLVATSSQAVDVTLRYDDGGPFRSLYRGRVDDSLRVSWDGLDAAGLPAPVDRVLLRVVSFAATGRLAGTQQLPLELRRVKPDTQPWPAPPPDSLLQPERAGGAPARRALLGGAVLSAAAVAIPGIVGGSETSAGPRTALAGAAGFAALVGYMLHRPGRPLAANVRANQALRDAWQQQLTDVQAENARRLAEVRLLIHAGAPTPLSAAGP